MKERNDWLDAINTAIEDYRSRKATFQAPGDGVAEGAAATSALTVAGRLGEAAPIWIPDQRVTMCQVCELYKLSHNPYLIIRYTR